MSDFLVPAGLLPKLDGLSLFRLTRRQSPTTTVILVTATAEVHDAMAAVRERAHSYLTKPVASEDIGRCIERIAAQASMERELVKVRVELAGLASCEQIVGRSTVMCRLMDGLNTIASSDAPVLLLGETGTGKELVARALHDRGPRRGKPFVAVNCASFPDTLLEPELFGHGGTLLLNEVGDMSAAAQVKLLRVLEQHTVDVRVVSATHRDLRKMTRDGLFREELYYRLNVLSIDVPPVR